MQEYKFHFSCVFVRTSFSVERWSDYVINVYLFNIQHSYSNCIFVFDTVLIIKNIERAHMINGENRTVTIMCYIQSHWLKLSHWQSNHMLLTWFIFSNMHVATNMINFSVSCIKYLHSFKNCNSPDLLVCRGQHLNVLCSLSYLEYTCTSLMKVNDTS